MNQCGQYRLQWEIIKYAADHGYKRYNFYGIQDVFNPQGKDYGVYEFKKGFGGYVEELLGSYIIDIDSKAKIYNLLRKIKKIIKRQSQPDKVDTIFFSCYILEEFYGKRGVRK